MGRNIVRCKILIFDTKTHNKAHWWKHLSSWDMLEWTHKSWKLKTQFWWNPSITQKHIDGMTKLNFYTLFWCKKYLCSKTSSQFPWNMKFLAIFAHLVQRIQRDLSKIVITLFPHSHAPLWNTLWSWAQILGTNITRMSDTSRAVL